MKLSDRAANRLATFILAIIVFGVAYSMFNSSRGERRPASQAIAEPTPTPVSLEMQLAIADGSQNDPVDVNRFRSLLADLDRSCVEDKAKIVAITKRTRSMLLEAGIDEISMPMLIAINKSLTGTRNQFAEWTAAYYVARKKGYGHDETAALLPRLVVAFKKQGGN